MGSILVVQPPFIFGNEEDAKHKSYDWYWIGCFMSLSSAACAAISFIFVAKLKDVTTLLDLMWYQCLCFIVTVCTTLALRMENRLFYSPQTFEWLHLGLGLFMAALTNL